MQSTVDSVVGLSLGQIDQFAAALFKTDQVAAERLTQQLNTISAGTNTRTSIQRCAATSHAGAAAFQSRCPCLSQYYRLPSVCNQSLIAIAATGFPDDPVPEGSRGGPSAEV